MTFFESIKTVFRKYAEFEGRASRPEFWWFTLFSALVVSALGTLNFTTMNGDGVLAIGSTLTSLWSIAVLLPTLAVTVRRLRDAGRDWKEIFWALLPLVGWILLLIRLADPTKPK